MAGSIFAPIINSCVKPLEKAARAIEIELVITIYFNQYSEKAQDIVATCGFNDPNGDLQRILCNRKKLNP